MPDDTQITSAVNSTSRRQFMGYAALSGGGMALVSCGVTFPELTAAEKQDLDILNYALTLEYLEAEFYNAFTGSGAYASRLTDTRVRSYARNLASHENDHVTALQGTTRALGACRSPSPTSTSARCSPTATAAPRP